MNTTETVALITGVSTFLAGTLAVLLTSMFNRQAADRVTRLEAYERLATAAEVLARRANGYRIQDALLPGANRPSLSYVTPAMLNSAVEEIIAAQASVQVWGSAIGRQKAEVLLVASKKYVQVALHEGEADESTALDDYIPPLQNARDDYMKAVRGEEMERSRHKWRALVTGRGSRPG